MIFQRKKQEKRKEGKEEKQNSTNIYTSIYILYKIYGKYKFPVRTTVFSCSRTTMPSSTTIIIVFSIQVHSSLQTTRGQVPAPRDLQFKISFRKSKRKEGKSGEDKQSKNMQLFQWHILYLDLVKIGVWRRRGYPKGRGGKKLGFEEACELRKAIPGIYNRKVEKRGEQK